MEAVVTLIISFSIGVILLILTILGSTLTDLSINILLTFGLFLTITILMILANDRSLLFNYIVKRYSKESRELIKNYGAKFRFSLLKGRFSIESPNGICVHVGYNAVSYAMCCTVYMTIIKRFEKLLDRYAELLSTKRLVVIDSSAIIQDLVIVRKDHLECSYYTSSLNTLNNRRLQLLLDNIDDILSCSTEFKFFMSALGVKHVAYNSNNYLIVDGAIEDNLVLNVTEHKKETDKQLYEILMSKSKLLEIKE